MGRAEKRQLTGQVWAAKNNYLTSEDFGVRENTVMTISISKRQSILDEAPH